MKILATPAIRFCDGCHQPTAQDWRCTESGVLLALKRSNFTLMELTCWDVNFEND
jgi:hypothetical protein